MMQHSLELLVAVQLLYAAFLGAVIGGGRRREGPLSMAVCLGACCLLKQRREDGLRSAALLWVTVAVGLAVAYSMVVPAAVTALILRRLGSTPEPA